MFVDTITKLLATLHIIYVSKITNIEKIYFFDSGIVRLRWKPLRVGKLIEVELVLKANHVQINNDYGKSGFVLPQMKKQFKEFWEKYEDKPLAGRNVIVQSICPEVRKYRLQSILILIKYF